MANTTAQSRIEITTNSAVGPAVRKVRRPPEFVAVSERAPETSIRRLEAMLAEAGSQLRGTQVGLMKLRGEISQLQHAACAWFAEIHAKYLRAIDAKTVKTGSAEMSPKAEPPDPYSEVGRARAKKERKDVAEFGIGPAQRNGLRGRGILRVHADCDRRYGSDLFRQGVGQENR